MEESGSLSVPTSTHNRVSVLQDHDRYKLMVKYLHSKLVANNWLVSDRDFGFSNSGTPSISNVSGTNTPRSSYNSPTHHGVLLRQTRGVYVTQPSVLTDNIMNAVLALNVEVAFTMQTSITDTIFTLLEPSQRDLVLQDGLQYQIYDSLEQVAQNAARVKKLQYACLIRQEKLVLLWSDRLEDILNHASDVERKLLVFLWGANRPFAMGTRQSSIFGGGSLMQSVNNSVTNLPLPPKIPDQFGGLASPTTVKPPPHEQDATSEDLEKLAAKESLGRPLAISSSLFIGAALMLMIILLFGFGTRSLVMQTLYDGKYLRLAWIAAYPFLASFGLFFFIVIFTNIFQVIGPVANIQSNSRYYSAIAPDLEVAYRQGFKPPHITIQMPVYKESLRTVLKPTIESLRIAISHYELNGGTASIFVNDDGMQIFELSEKEADKQLAEERKAYYHDNNIGWVARPPHKHNGFERTGKFKKASNMNFGLNIANRVEDKLREYINARGDYNSVTLAEEEELYERALSTVLEEDGKATAGGNIRIGEIILIVDSDTRVPPDCLLYGAAEMFLNPEVAIIQHNAGVMQVVGDYFENGITHFTRSVYTAIRFAIGHGESAPFMGHNSFLRWQAVQSVAIKEGDQELYWSDKHVSEDFDIALRLQIAGNVIRFASYHGDGFKEGVSLTVHDELSRWEKYAYGVNELVFNPIWTWPWKGPFSRLFLRMLFSPMSLSSKISTIGYIFSYYAIAAGLPLTIVNYFMIGWYNGYIDEFYTDSWKVFFSLLVVFTLMSNVTLAILRYRLGEQGFFSSLLENFKWMPLFAIFFGGIPFHVGRAILSHMFSIDMQWGATAKEAEFSNFFMEIPKIFKRYKYMYMFTVPMVGCMIYLGRYAPRGYEIQGFTAIVPLAVNLASHMILPFVLNPALMVFNY